MLIQHIYRTLDVNPGKYWVLFKRVNNGFGFVSQVSESVK